MQDNTSVLQDWLVKIPIRMQSTLVLGLRGPDTHCAPNVKKIGRWLRGLTFKPGNPNNFKEFMSDKPDRIIEKSAVAKELEFCTQHFYSHLMHSLEVVAYRHPDGYIANYAYVLFSDMCNLFHLPIEMAENFENRLKTIEWPNGQPDTFEEAVSQLEIQNKAFELDKLRKQKNIESNDTPFKLK
jgi:hypothetical protein